MTTPTPEVTAGMRLEAERYWTRTDHDFTHALGRTDFLVGAYRAMRALEPARTPPESGDAAEQALLAKLDAGWLAIDCGQDASDILAEAAAHIRAQSEALRSLRTLPQIAEARMDDINKLTWQVRDARKRAETAESDLAALREASAGKDAEIAQRIEAYEGALDAWKSARTERDDARRERDSAYVAAYAAASGEIERLGKGWADARALRWLRPSSE